MVKKTPKVALVYDWIDTPHGGAERVLQNLHQLYPQAPIFTSIYNPDQAKWAADIQITPSFLQKLPRFARDHKKLALALPIAFESFDLSEYDLVISVSSGPAKGVITSPDQLHINYCLTPPRYLYTHRQRYLHKFSIFSGLVNWLLRYLKWWDLAASSRPDVYIPISKVVEKRIKDIYQRRVGEVVYPPVSIKGWIPDQVGNDSGDKSGYYLVVSRLVGYKKVDVAIKACQELGRKLIIVGEGEEKSRLQKLSKSGSLKFVGSVDEQELANLYNGACGLIMVGEEDFGITGLESLAAGVPVLINQNSGVAELIEDQVAGVHLADESVTELKAGILKLEKLTINKKKLIATANQYIQEKFKQQIKAMVDRYWHEFI